MGMQVASSATGKVLGRFRPTERFNWIETDDEGIPAVKGIYQPKFEYTIRNDLLLAKARAWAADGKVKLWED